MLSRLDLNGSWKLRGFDGQHGTPEAHVGETTDERTFIDAQVPGEVHLDLERAGWIPDCNIGLNAQYARWVEEQVWVYRTQFTAPADALAKRVWLVFDSLDLNAVIYLNGESVGTHNDLFMPCRLDVTGKLKEGANTLAVRIESGLYYSAEKPGSVYAPGLPDVLTKRPWLRKPQCQFSWDWSPRLVNVGIPGGVRLEWTDTARIDAVTVFPELAENHKSAVLNARVFIDNTLTEARKAVVRLSVPTEGLVRELEVDLPAGASRQDLSVTIQDPKLWWPRPHGDQPLYGVLVEVLIDGQVVDSAERRTGIRSIRINQDPHPVTGEYFILEVNGVPIFAKGGNWVPPDIIPARVDEKRYRDLVQIAVDANCNALRIWGGGLYADHRFLDACDELGVLIWHDLIFACAKYPGDDGEFVEKVQQEVTYNVRDLSQHPSLVVWCGNNELEWVYPYWEFQKSRPLPDHALFHYYFPRIMKEEDPSRPYWPSSPYSSDCRQPNDYTTGDQHPWHVFLQEDGPDMWKYRENVSRFPNEGGILGAVSPATIKQFLPEEQYKLFSPMWEFHDNACNYWGDPPMVYRFFEYWLGRKADSVPFDDYLFYSAVMQSEGLQEYINNFRRRMFSTSSAIFWMYNDTWPASHSWTIVDYYLRRKLSYHPVRRAFAPVHVIPVIEGDKMVVYGVNDTLQEWSGQARYGVFTLSGEIPVEGSADVTLAPNAATIIGELPVAEWEAVGKDASGAFGLLLQNGSPVAQNRLFIAPYKELKFAAPEITVTRRGGKAVFSSPTFVWGVCIDPDGEQPIADDLFDLIPGIEYEIDWPEDKDLPVVAKCASPLFQ